jgi:hypothetical protein
MNIQFRRSVINVPKPLRSLAIAAIAAIETNKTVTCPKRFPERTNEAVQL